MNDKDRMGDKLRDKGKASEDLFIAEQERRALERARADAVRPECPRDGTKLTLTDADGVSIDVCPTCSGVWLDKGELELLLQKEEAAITTWVRSLLGS